MLRPSGASTEGGLLSDEEGLQALAVGGARACSLSEEMVRRFLTSLCPQVSCQPFGQPVSLLDAGYHQDTKSARPRGKCG